MNTESTGVVPPFPGRLEQGVVIPGEDHSIPESFLLEWVTQKLRPLVNAVTSLHTTAYNAETISDPDVRRQ